MMADNRSLEAVWVRRAKDFRKEIVPYLGYMGQSGFPLFISLIVISATLGYFKLIHHLPSEFPITLVGTFVMLPVLCWTPLRTWLAAADIVFHMPRESEMGAYLRRSFNRSITLTALLSAFVLLVYWPIYKQGPGIASGWILILFAAALRAGNTWGAWRERQLAWPNVRRLLRLLRYAATGLAWAAVLLRAPWQAAAFTLLICVLFMLLYRIPSSHPLPWERLIEEEARTRRSYYSFFGLFIDVPTMPSKAASRPYLSWLLKLIPFRFNNTYVYLYAGSLLRTEIGGIVIRLLLLSALIVYWFAEAAWLSGWGAAVVYILAILIVSAQLSGLRHTHRYSVWRHVYPLPDSQRMDSLVIVDRWALLIVSIVMWLPSGIMLIWQGLLVPAMFALLVAFLYIWSVRPGRMKRSLKSDADEE